MKRMLIFSILAGSCAIASAQYDDVYSDFAPKQVKVEYASATVSEPATPATTSTRDVDEYNRRFAAGSDTYLESDTVQEDFSNTKKIVKYHNSDAVTINDPQYVYIYNGDDGEDEDLDEGSEDDNISAFMAGYSAGLFNGWWFDWYCPGYYIYPHRYAYYRWYDPWWYHPYHPWHVWHPYHPHYYRPYAYVHHPRPYRHMPAAYGPGAGRPHASRDFGMGARQDLKPHTTVRNLSTRSTQQPGNVTRTGSSTRGQAPQAGPAAGNRSTSGSRPQGVYNSGAGSRPSAGGYNSSSSTRSSSGSYRSGSSTRSSGGYSGGSSSRSSFGGGSSYRSSGGYSGGSSRSSGGFSGGSSGRSSGSFGGSRGGSSSRGR